MLKMVLKNAKYKYTYSLCALTITILILIKIEGFEDLSALRVIYGGFPLGRPTIMLAFVLSVALVQYINVDAILYLLKNDTYLIIRYENRGLMFRNLLKNMFALNIIYVIVAILSMLVSMAICKWSFELHIFYEILEISARGFLTCVILTVIQALLLMRLDEVNTLMLMTGITVFFAFVSRLNLWVFTWFPFHLEDKDLITNIVLCLVYVIGALLVFRKLYQRKEVGKL